MIRATQLSKAFGAVSAVRQASFVAADGAVTGLLGPNGAGKTTILRMLYGLYRPDGGWVEIDGERWQARPEEGLGRIGALPDVAGLYARLTPREHLLYAARLHGLDGPDAIEAARLAIDRFEIRELADRRCVGFSHGERRRVSMARALVHDPPNVILDEPTNGLDVLAIRRMRRTLRTLADEGKCILFSSHVMQEVAALCDRVIVLMDGRVVAEETPAELMAATETADLEEAFVRLTGIEAEVGEVAR